MHGPLAHAAQRAHILTAYYSADRPASAQANPIIFMFSIFGLLGGTMLALEVILRTASDAFHDRLPWQHPVTIMRLRTGLFTLALLLYIGPDAIAIICWPDVVPQTRYLIAVANRILDGAALPLFMAAWMVGIYGQQTVAYQLKRDPIPMHLWPEWSALVRPLKIAGLVLILSAGLSIGR